MVVASFRAGDRHRPWRRSAHHAFDTLRVVPILEMAGPPGTPAAATWYATLR